MQDNPFEKIRKAYPFSRGTRIFSDGVDTGLPPGWEMDDLGNYKTDQGWWILKDQSKFKSPDGTWYTKDDIQQSQQLQTDISKLFPQEDIQQLSDYAEKDPQQFIKHFQDAGDTPLSRSVLKSLGLQDTDINLIFAPPQGYEYNDQGKLIQNAALKGPDSWGINPFRTGGPWEGDQAMSTVDIHNPLSVAAVAIPMELMAGRIPLALIGAAADVLGPGWQTAMGIAGMDTSAAVAPDYIGKIASVIMSRLGGSAEKTAAKFIESGLARGAKMDEIAQSMSYIKGLKPETIQKLTGIIPETKIPGAAGAAAQVAPSATHPEPVKLYSESIITDTVNEMPLVQAKPPPIEARPPTIKPTPTETPAPAKPLSDFVSPNHTPDEVNNYLKKFNEILVSPKTERFRELTLEMRRKVLSSRIAAFQLRAEQLIIDGLNPEQAMSQATQETMAGKLPDITNTVFDDIAVEMRDVLFSKVYHDLVNEPFEILSTAEALRNALLGRSIPRTPGVKGGSAYTRLLRIFGDNPKVMELLDEPKSLKAIVEDLFYGANKHINIDQEMADYLRQLPNRPYQQGVTWLSGQAPMDLGDVPFAPQVESALLKNTQPWDIPGVQPDPRTQDQRILDFLFDTRGETPPLGDVPPETPVAKIVKQQLPGMPVDSQNILIEILKKTALTIGDIGNLIRANVASADFSFWRQQAPMILAHPKRFAEANVKALKALISEDAAKESWLKITQDPLYGLYDDLGLDFLRPAMGAPGIPEWRLVEEFGYGGANRLISKFTEKIPWVKWSQRSFTVGTNEHNWSMFKDFYGMLLKANEEAALGKIRFSPGESLNAKKDLLLFGKMLEDFSGRGSLGKAKSLASTLSGLFFAPRMVVGRLATPRHLFSPSVMVRKEAWKNLGAFVAGISGVMLLGKTSGWWDVETDSRSPDFMKIKIGNTRIDPWGGYQQYVTFFSRVISGSGISSTTGETYKTTPWDSLTRFFQSKSSPLASFITQVWTGKTFLGEKVDFTSAKQWADRIAPMAAMQIYETYQENFAMGILLTIPSLLGISVQTYRSATSPSVIKKRVLSSEGINLPPAPHKLSALETFQNQLTSAEYEIALQYYETTYRDRINSEIIKPEYINLSDADKKKRIDKIATATQKDMIAKYTKTPPPATSDNLPAQPKPKAAPKPKVIKPPAPPKPTPLSTFPGRRTGPAVR
jgi:hypothetical protein